MHYIDLPLMTSVVFDVFRHVRPHWGLAPAAGVPGSRMATAQTRDYRDWHIYVGGVRTPCLYQSVNNYHKFRERPFNILLLTIIIHRCRE